MGKHTSAQAHADRHERTKQSLRDLIAEDGEVLLRAGSGMELEPDHLEVIDPERVNSAIREFVGQHKDVLREACRRTKKGDER